MISRRVLRIKVMHAIYSYYKHAGSSSINEKEKELFFSIEKSHDLFHLLLVLLIELQNYAQKRIELAQNKRLPSQEDLKPNKRFIDNRLINMLRINEQLLRYVEIKKLNWVNHPGLIKELYTQIIESTEYTNYINSETDSFKSDKNFVITVLKNIIASNENLYHTLEEESIFWNDEVEFILGAIIKTISKFKLEQAEEAPLPSLYKNEDDKDFAKQLFRKTILKSEDYKKLIGEFSKNWDFDRIAFMDILLMEMAIAEVIEFSNIPVKVTFNEYIELSKYYSTNRSNTFINGILDKIFNHLKENKTIVKQGRGLID